MKTTRFFILGSVLLLIGLFFGSCQHCIDGQGSMQKEKHVLPAFNALYVEVPADITIKKGDTTLMIVEAPQNILRLLESRVKRGTLRITSPCYHAEKPVKISITVRSLQKISLSGSGKIKVMDALTPKKLKLSISGSGSIETDVLSLRVDAEIDGSGVMIINGTTEEFNAEINGSGAMRTLGLRAEEVDTEINGSGEIFVTAKDKLIATIKGSGVIHYTGNPDVRTKINGSGNVSKVN